jgi:hypothetical protein
MALRSPMMISAALEHQMLPVRHRSPALLVPHPWSGSPEQVRHAYAHCRALASRLEARGALRAVHEASPTMRQLVVACQALAEEAAATLAATQGAGAGSGGGIGIGKTEPLS